MKTNLKLVFTAATLGCLSVTMQPLTATAQSAGDLVGAWTNVGNINVRADGSRVPVFGPNGKGIAIFDAGGHFAIINVNPDTPKFAANNRAQGTNAENKAAMEGGIALFGTYTVSPDKVISFKIDGSTYPNWTGSEQKRVLASFSKDQFTWTLPASIGGTAEVSWRRLK